MRWARLAGRSAGAAGAASQSALVCHGAAGIQPSPLRLPHLGPSLQVLRLPHSPGLHPGLVDLVLLVRGVGRACACVWLAGAGAAAAAAAFSHMVRLCRRPNPHAPPVPLLHATHSSPRAPRAHPTAPLHPSVCILVFCRTNPLAYTLYGLIVTQLGNLSNPIDYNSEQVPIYQFLEDRFGYK